MRSGKDESHWSYIGIKIKKCLLCYCHNLSDAQEKAVILLNTRYKKGAIPYKYQDHARQRPDGDSHLALLTPCGALQKQHKRHLQIRTGVSRQRARIAVFQALSRQKGKMADIHEH